MVTMRFARHSIVLAAVLFLSGCTSMVPRKNLPYPLTDSNFGDPVKVVTVPLPVIASSPNEGITAGALTAFLLYNDRDEVNTLLAPQVNYNQNFGVTTSIYGAFYPSPSRSWEVNLAQATRKNFDYEVKTRDKTFLDGKMELNGFFCLIADGSSRFYGFQARTPHHQETNYTDQDTGFNVSIGYDFGRHYQIVFGERYREVGIHTGAVSGIPFIRDKFTEQQVPGINGFTTHAQRLSLIYSTLDSKDAPTFGGYAKATIENSSTALGSSADFHHYELEMKGFIPLYDARYITAFRGVYNQTIDKNVPFLEQSILGGETTLRGYGRNRFIDNCYVLLNLEERIRLFRWEVFNVTADWELAPFMDIGSVMRSFGSISARDFEFNPGVGVRALVRPNILGRVDVGFGRDGPAVFVGLGYPF